MEYSDERKLVIGRVFDAPIELVWKALTDIELLKQWSPFFPEFEPVVGFVSRFWLGPDDDHQYLHVCEVTEVIERKKLTYTWAYDGQVGDSHVTFELSDDSDRTKVTFTHEIIEPFPDYDPNFALNSFIQGWTYTLDALQAYAEKREAV